MTQNYAVEKQGGSPLVYGGLGAAVGAVGGTALAKRAGLGVPVKYQSWEDAVSATSANDKFVAKRAAAEKESKLLDKIFGNQKDFKELYKQQQAVAEARNKALEGLSDDAKKHIDVQSYVDDLAKYEEKVNDLVEEYVKKGKLEGIADDLTDDIVKLKDEIRNSNLVKTEREALEHALERAKKVDGFTDDVAKGVAGKIDDVIKVRNTACRSLNAQINEKTILNSIKKVSNKWTAIALGGVGLLLGLIVRPKGKERA